MRKMEAKVQVANVVTYDSLIITCAMASKAVEAKAWLRAGAGYGY